jgi:hypothetical protein
VTLTFDELKARRKPREDSIGVPIDQQLLEQIAELERAIEIQKVLDSQLNRIPEAPKTQKRLDELQTIAADAAEWFTFRELPRKVFKELVRQHPPLDERGKPGGKGRWNEETFAPALIAASCVSHDFTEAQWTELWDEWGAWIMYPLFACAYQVNEDDSQVPFGSRKSGGTRDSATNSTSADGSESPTPTS